MLFILLVVDNHINWFTMLLNNESVIGDPVSLISNALTPITFTYSFNNACINVIALIIKLSFNSYPYMGFPIT